MLEKIMSFLSLFGSGATLLCCALPATLSIIAGGAAVGSLLSAFPWLIPLSRHHNLLFLIAGTLLTINGIFVLQPKGTVACAVTGGKGCEVAGGMTKGIFWFSVILYSIGTFAAYALAPILRFFN